MDFLVRILCVYLKGWCIYCVRFGGFVYFLKVVVSSYSSIFEKTGLECFQQQLVTDDKRKKLLMQHLYSFNLLPSPHPTSPSLRDFETELKCRHFPNKWTKVFLEEE